MAAPAMAGTAIDSRSGPEPGNTSCRSRVQITAGMIPEASDRSDIRAIAVRDPVVKPTSTARAVQMNHGAKGKASATHSPSSSSSHHGAPAMDGSTTQITRSMEAAQATGTYRQDRFTTGCRFSLASRVVPYGASDMVVLAAAGDFLGTVELLGEDQAHQLVWKDQLGQAPGEVRALVHRCVDAVGTANHHGDVA